MIFEVVRPRESDSQSDSLKLSLCLAHKNAQQILADSLPETLINQVRVDVLHTSVLLSWAFSETHAIVGIKWLLSCHPQLGPSEKQVCCTGVHVLNFSGFPQP